MLDMQRRSGATLVEVLVAIFIMALGLLTLLALFPLGVLTMAQAIQDDRTANAAGNAAAIAIAQDIRHDPNVTPLFLNPDPNKVVYADAPPDGPSYPVYVDVMGARSYLGLYAQWVGGQNVAGQGAGVPRGTVTFVKTTSDALQWFSLLDDIYFDNDPNASPSTMGYPKIEAANNNINIFYRQNLYTWAYLLRRPLQGDPTVVEVSVIVYNSRSLALNSSLQGDEVPFNATFDPTSNIVSLSWAANQDAPKLRVGSWIMDTTLVPSPQGAAQPYSGVHANFYRVVAVTETSDTSMDVEVQTPLRDFPLPNTNPPALTGTVVVLDGVAEVFEKRTGWRP
jgi:hypothetical protein